MAEPKRAVIIRRNDNVLTVLEEVAAGESACAGEANATAVERIPQYHKIALADIPRGAPLFKYGELIGYAQCDIPRGSWVHTHNLASTMIQGDWSADA